MKINNNDSDLLAIGAFIFGGSATLGVIEAGYHVDRILEMTDNMLELNAYHFHKNMPEVNYVLPSRWDTNQYLTSLQSKNYDLFYGNPPCSGLSRINKNSRTDAPTNIHFYREFDIIERIQPKTFFIENAPALIKHMGFPILINMFNRLSYRYKFTVIRDLAGNHGVTMKRMRTLIVGWRRDVFDDKIPLLQMNFQPTVTVKDLIGDLYDVPLGEALNHEVVLNREWGEFDYLLPYVDYHVTFLRSMIKYWDTLRPHFLENKNYLGQIERARAKLNAGKEIWDKSPVRMLETDLAPSITSITHNIHPIHHRQWTIREYARLMGYPDDFEFYIGENQTPIIQTIAQGVPANFVKYITNEIHETLRGNRELHTYDYDQILVFQHHGNGFYRPYTLNELRNGKELEYYPADKSFEKLKK